MQQGYPILPRGPQPANVNWGSPTQPGSVNWGGPDSSSVDVFFQAEDGIRDLTVTGVQTCALPISQRPVERAGDVGEREDERCLAGELGWCGVACHHQESRVVLGVVLQVLLEDHGSVEIGRASCRERV